MIEQSNFKKLRVFGSMILGKTAVLMAQRQNGKFASSTQSGVFAAVNGGTTEIVTEARTLTVEDSGKVFGMSGGSYTIGLPTLASAPGWRGRFVLSDSAAVPTITAPDATTINGTIVVVGAAVPAVGETNINFAAAAVAGDYVDLFNDGAQWFVNGMGNATGAITATA